MTSVALALCWYIQARARITTEQPESIVRLEALIATAQTAETRNWNGYIEGEIEKKESPTALYNSNVYHIAHRTVHYIHIRGEYIQIR